MASKIKNIIIFTVIAAILILAYIFFIKPSPEEKNLVSSPGSPSATLPNTDTLKQNSLITKDFLSVLLSVKNVKLDDSIFSDSAFVNLHDSSIILIPTGDEGRLNPFAPIGYEASAPIPSPIIPPPPTP